jgi:DNA-binding transcriptional LysR family regulator
MVEAAIAGLGIAFVPQPFVRDAIAQHELLVVLDEWCPPLQGLCLYYAGHRHVPDTLKAFIRVVKEQTSSHTYGELRISENSQTSDGS